ncbi:hypothetical protein OIU79_009131 [Salix purpurea]|uniref:Uncharacterized protein n=1 Tax=Salix purpurea TaxID=77065 RepID=A0A9Q0TKA7_SALPP|nr:hypothetical protein OIU79_009131 [Salix purpurea]
MQAISNTIRVPSFTRQASVSTNRVQVDTKTNIHLKRGRALILVLLGYWRVSIVVHVVWRKLQIIASYKIWKFKVESNS